DLFVDQIALHGRVTVDHQSEISLHGRDQKLGRGAIGNNREIDTRGRLQELSGQILRASDIDRSDVERTRFCFCRGDEIRKRLELRLRIGGEDKIKKAQAGNWLELPQRI